MLLQLFSADIIPSPLFSSFHFRSKPSYFFFFSFCLLLFFFFFFSL